MLRRSVLALALAIFTLAPLAHVHAARLAGGGVGAALLRYHFVSGQVLTYRLQETDGSDVDTTGTSGLPSDAQATLASLNASVRLGGLVRERVRGVDATGVATVTVRVSSLAITSTASGRATPISNTTIPTETARIAPNGSEQAVAHAAGTRTLSPFKIQSGPIFPPGPVQPGARWTTTTTTTFSLPSLGADATIDTDMGSGAGEPGPSFNVTTHNLFAGYGQAGGEPVAVIDTVTPLSVSLTIPETVSDRAAQLTETGTATARVLFGLDSGQLVSSKTDEDLRLVVKQQDAHGKPTSLASRLTLDTTIQRVSP